MQNLWQKKQKLKYSLNVVDIIQFGSSVIENSTPNDLDIAVIYKKISLKEQLNESQKIKKQIEKITGMKVDIISFDLYSFFEKSNFSKEGILFYGKSLITKKNFSENFGLIPRLNIEYDLSNLEKKEKVRFNYLLSGKTKKYGLIKKHSGKILKPGLLEINPEKEKIFLGEISKITKKFKIKKIFIQ